MSTVQHVVVGVLVVSLFGLAFRLLFRGIGRELDSFDRSMCSASDFEQWERSL